MWKIQVFKSAPIVPPFYEKSLVCAAFWASRLSSSQLKRQEWGQAERQE